MGKTVLLNLLFTLLAFVACVLAGFFALRFPFEKSVVPGLTPAASPEQVRLFLSMLALGLALHFSIEPARLPKE